MNYNNYQIKSNQITDVSIALSICLISSLLCFFCKVDAKSGLFMWDIVWDALASFFVQQSVDAENLPGSQHHGDLEVPIFHIAVPCLFSALALAVALTPAYTELLLFFHVLFLF